MSDQSGRSNETAIDFREAAVAESVRGLSATGNAAPLLAGLSLCLRVEGEGDTAERIKALNKMMVIGAVVGVALLVVSVAMLGLGLLQMFTDWHFGFPFFTTGAASGGGAWLLTKVISKRAVNAQRQKLAETINTRTGGWFDYHPENAPAMIVFRVEDAATADKLKLNEEDLVVAYIDAARRRLVIEGIRYRYIVRAEDVLRFDRRDGNRMESAIDLSYRVGEAVLTMVLFHTGGLEGMSKAQQKFRTEDLVDDITYALWG